ncbi:hypothetical protein ACHHYP_20810 [Achlya hypogyna]|uniref:Uncharacterized protein n=1 Tax=Achlya hypogyna TaxID=1202772 RepID=A0A1V9Y942_ACHHY|nr:hypothetical protein ACHHYP_20810 [Achlya hypogyna]
MTFESLKAMDGGFQHTESIQIERISYEDDALGVTYYHTKTDQAGLKRRDTRHIYSNLACPGI